MITKEKAFENIQKTCEERLNQIYCAGIPDFVNERLQLEKKHLKIPKPLCNLKHIEKYRE